MSSFESVPTTWEDARDSAFFRIVLHLLPADTELWSSALLASNDTELTGS
jgi:hypothetical protein